MLMVIDSFSFTLWLFLNIMIINFKLINLIVLFINNNIIMI